MSRRVAILLLVTLSSCAKTGGPYPSLAHRPAESIDPRVPVIVPMNDRAASPRLLTELDALVAQARRGDADFGPAIDSAERAANAAGAPRSEAWIVAQESLSVAIAARSPTAHAVGDVDAIAATMAKTNGGIAPNDLKAINDAAAMIHRMDAEQTARLKAVQDRLGN